MQVAAPALIHWVAAVPDAATAYALLAAQGWSANGSSAPTAPPVRLTRAPDGSADGRLPAHAFIGGATTTPATPARQRRSPCRPGAAAPDAAVLGRHAQSPSAWAGRPSRAAHCARITATLATPRGPATSLPEEADHDPPAHPAEDVEAAAHGLVYSRLCRHTAVPLGAAERTPGHRPLVKHENHTPVGAFKIRGGLTYFDQLARRGALPR